MEGGASICLSYILVTGCASQKSRGIQPGLSLSSASVEEPLQALISWVVSQLQSSASSSLTLVTPTLTVLMGIGYISRHLRVRQGSAGKRSKEITSAPVQQLYELCFCLWTLTYELHESMTARTHFARDGAIPALVDLVTVAPREKVVRVALSALSNLAEVRGGHVLSDEAGKKDINSSTFLSEMIGCGLIKSIDLMKDRQWADPDMVAGKMTCDLLCIYNRTNSPDDCKVRH
jgi:V-ATPase subunit H